MHFLSSSHCRRHQSGANRKESGKKAAGNTFPCLPELILHTHRHTHTSQLFNQHAMNLRNASSLARSCAQLIDPRHNARAKRAHVQTRQPEVSKTLDERPGQGHSCFGPDVIEVSFSCGVYRFLPALVQSLFAVREKKQSHKGHKMGPHWVRKSSRFGGGELSCWQDNPKTRASFAKQADRAHTNELNGAGPNERQTNERTNEDLEKRGRE